MGRAEGAEMWSQEERWKGVRVSDRGLHGPAEALLIHGGVELTGEGTAPPLMIAAKVGVGGDVGAGWHVPLALF